MVVVVVIIVVVVVPFRSFVVLVVVYFLADYFKGLDSRLTLILDGEMVARDLCFDIVASLVSFVLLPLLTTFNSVVDFVADAELKRSTASI